MSTDSAIFITIPIEEYRLLLVIAFLGKVSTINKLEIQEDLQHYINTDRILQKIEELDKLKSF